MPLCIEPRLRENARRKVHGEPLAFASSRYAKISKRSIGDCCSAEINVPYLFLVLTIYRDFMSPFEIVSFAFRNRLLIFDGTLSIPSPPFGNEKPFTEIKRDYFLGRSRASATCFRDHLVLHFELYIFPKNAVQRERRKKEILRTCSHTCSLSSFKWHALMANANVGPRHKRNSRRS